MNTTNKSNHDRVLEKLLTDYVALCNRAIAQNGDRFWYGKAKQLNKALWGGANFRTIVYDDNPDDIRGEFLLHFDAESQVLSIVPDEGEEVAFSWKVPVAYLVDVVMDRPDWYLAHPLRLDWTWIRQRVSDEVVQPLDGRSLVVGFVFGIAAVLFASRALSRGWRRSTWKHPNWKHPPWKDHRIWPR